jgi:hypothetical protein
VLSPALRGALDISLIASAALRHTALSSIRGSKRILFYTQTVMKKCETLHKARVINCGRLLERQAASSCYCTETGEQRYSETEFVAVRVKISAN